jgi:hypothetical protein
MGVWKWKRGGWEGVKSVCKNGWKEEWKGVLRKGGRGKCIVYGREDRKWNR